MSDSTATPPAPEAPQEGAEQEPKVFDAEYVDKLRKENAKYRTDAKANAEAAAELAKIRESQKTEAEKQAERLAELESEAKTARAEALRLRIATKHGISDEDADLFLTGSDEETLTKQAERLAAREADRKKNGNRVPHEGSTPTPAAGEADRRAFVRQLTGRN